jgi:DNA-binding MarR family transcriptional regulator
VKQLEREGLVTRRTNPEDNRFTLVTLTTAGRELLERLAGARPEFYQRARSDLTPEELAAVRTVLQRLQANLAAMPVETAGQRQRG